MVELGFDNDVSSRTDGEIDSGSSSHDDDTAVDMNNSEPLKGG